MNDKIAVALKNSVYLYDHGSGHVEPLDSVTTFGSEKLYPASVKWIGDVRAPTTIGISYH